MVETGEIVKKIAGCKGQAVALQAVVEIMKVPSFVRATAWSGTVPPPFEEEHKRIYEVLKMDLQIIRPCKRLGGRQQESIVT